VTDPSSAATQFDQLAGLLAHDPTNERLATDAATAALDAGRFSDATALIERFGGEGGALPPPLANLAGLAAMGAEDWPAASRRFAELREQGADAPAIRFNLAWSLAMQGEPAEAIACLDDETVVTLPQAAALRIQLLHDRGAMDDAERDAGKALERFPDHAGLNAAISTLAIDLEDRALAARCAAAAGGHPEALTTSGTLALGEDQPARAATLFEQALDRNPNLPRAWIGRGLVRLLGPDKIAAAADLDHGATLFDSHIGSWIAAGWAHMLAGDATAARSRFERALALDDRFAESHGSLAALDALAGDRSAAERGMAVALRLDRACFSAALAGVLLATSEGNAARAQQVMTTALSTPIGDDGRTIAETMVRLGLAGR
jgi:tetratricopeptide (TPR) repeat protein